MSPRLSVRDLKSDISGPFSFDLPAATCITVTGPSGSGKSLLLRMLADLDPCEGVVELDGHARDSFTPPDWRRQVTYVAADSGWWSESVADHFTAAQRAAAGELAEAMALAPALLDAMVLRLSTGERQRLALVRALVEPRAVLLLDEPTGPLDVATTARVEALLRARIEAGAALVLVTHDDALAARLGQQHYRMHERRFAET